MFLVYSTSRYSEIFSVYHDRFDNIFIKTESLKDRISDLKLVVAKSEDALRLQQRKVEVAADNVKESQLTLTKLQKEYKKSVTTMKAKQKAFDEGIAAYKAKAAARATFGFLKIVGQVTSAIAGVYGSAPKGNTFVLTFTTFSNIPYDYYLLC